MTLFGDGWSDLSACPDFYRYYAVNLRPGLFTGFLTLGSFLLTMLTLTVTNMRSGVYDTPGYRKVIAKKRALNKQLRIYRPLHNLCRMLLGTVSLAMLTSVAQITLGLFWRNDWSAGICLGLAFLTAGCLAGLIRMLFVNFRVLFAEWEDDGNEKLIAEQKKLKELARQGG